METRDCEGLLAVHSLLRKIFFYVFRVALTDNSMKLRILKICVSRFYSYGRCRVTFFFQNGICLHGKTWVSKFFVTQSRFAEGLESVVKKREVSQSFFLFYSYNDLSHEK